MAGTSEDFLQEDYKQKISYLTNHLGRMWTRFNFFVTIESALLGGKVLLVGDKPSPMIGVAGIILSLVWYVMGAQDRFLTGYYRWQVKEAAGRLRDMLDRPAKANNSMPEDEKLYQDKLMIAVRAATSNYVGCVDNEFVGQYSSWRNGKIANPVSRFLERSSSWRSKQFSITHLAAWIPLVASVSWLVYLVVQQWMR